MSLESNIALQIEELCDRGYQLYDEQSFEAALRFFYQAWPKIPKPQAQYPHAAWVLTAIGDSYYKLPNYGQSIEVLNSALHCPGGQLAFIHTRLAQAYYESGDKNSSAEHFQKAEEMDPKQTQKLEPKYRLFIKNNRLKR